MAAKNTILVVGSLAYDHLMKFDGVFKDVVVPGNFNIAITASQRNISYGGCAGNIAYSLRLLGQHPTILTVAGKDFEQYKKWLVNLNIPTSFIYESEEHYTASAFIVTDKEENQITIFDAGAMHEFVNSQSIKKLPSEKISWAIIAPDNPERMIRAAHECRELDIPYIFDPAQQITHIKYEELLWIIENAKVLIVNEYEAELLSKKLGIPREQLSSLVSMYIETHGAKGCSVKSPEGMSFVRSVQPSKMVDPTGCGDAFRAGVLMGLQQKFTLQKCCQIGALLATYNLEQGGTQNHKFSLAEFAERFENNFNESL